MAALLLVAALLFVTAAPAAGAFYVGAMPLNGLARIRGVKQHRRSMSGGIF